MGISMDYAWMSHKKSWRWSHRLSNLWNTRNSLQWCWWQVRRICRCIVACWFMKPRFLIRPDLSKHPQLMCRGTGGTEDNRICWCLRCLQGSMLKNRITISISRISVSVMSLPCLAWLISVSICLGGISTQLDGNSHDDNSRLLQITLVPLESSKLLSMKEWKSSRDLARVEPVQHISLTDLTDAEPEPIANFKFQCSATVRSRYEQIEATCVAQRDEEWWESRVVAWFQ